MVTVQSIVNQMTSAYYPVDFSLSSTNIAQDNFNYIADIYINASPNKTVRLRFPPNPTNGYGYCDISGTLQQYLTHDPNINENGDTFIACSGSIVYYNVQFGEEYGASSGITQYANQVSNTGYATNSVRDYLDGGGSLDQYVLTDDKTLFLTNIPRAGANISYDDYFNLYFLSNTALSGDYFQVNEYDSSGVLISSESFNNPYTSLPFIASRYIDIDVSPNVLGIDANTSYYTVAMFTQGDDQSSEVFRINIKTFCSKQTPITFCFQNKLGAYDYFTMSGSNGRSTDIDKKFFKSKQGSWGGNLFSYQFSDRAEAQYSTSLKDKLFANSNWLTANESVWLEELVTSPDVYVLLIPNGEKTKQYIPVDIKQTNYPVKTIEVDGIFNLQIQYEYSFNRYRQRR